MKIVADNLSVTRPSARICSTLSLWGNRARSKKRAVLGRIRQVRDWSSINNCTPFSVNSNRKWWALAICYLQCQFLKAAAVFLGNRVNSSNWHRPGEVGSWKWVSELPTPPAFVLTGLLFNLLFILRTKEVILIKHWVGVLEFTASRKQRKLEMVSDWQEQKVILLWLLLFWLPSVDFCHHQIALLSPAAGISPSGITQLRRTVPQSLSYPA